VSTLVPLSAWATAQNLSVRQAQVYRKAGRLPGAVETAKGWLVPFDTTPLPPTSHGVAPRAHPATSHDVAPGAHPAISHDVAATSRALGMLGTLEDAAHVLGTTVGGVRRMAADGLLVVGRYGPYGALRVYVPPPR
jgi:hypothetical protein